MIKHSGDSSIWWPRKVTRECNGAPLWQAGVIARIKSRGRVFGTQRHPSLACCALVSCHCTFFWLVHESIQCAGGRKAMMCARHINMRAGGNERDGLALSSTRSGLHGVRIPFMTSATGRTDSTRP